MTKHWALVAALMSGCSTQIVSSDASPINTIEDYMVAIAGRVSRNWHKPEQSTEGIECTVLITQDVTGTIQDVAVQNCNGTEEEIAAIENAVLDSSPLPLPGDPDLFDPDIRFVFCPSC